MTENEKIEKLASLHSEVSDFHPVLNGLFRNLPNVVSHEYTHGTNEMGADFVIEVCDSVLKSINYVGVIAKIGKISLSNVADIARQVSECTVERHYSNGKKRIYITAIWVVSNNTISEPAQRKIHEDFRARTVEFLPGQTLVSLIDNHFKTYWTDIGTEIAVYLRKTAAYIAETDARLSLLKDFGTDIYIEPDIREVDESDYRADGVRISRRGKSVDLLESIKTHKVIFIEGEPGVGKSKLLRNIASKCCQPDHFKSHKIIPIFFTFKEYCEKYNERLDDLIRDKLAESYDGLNEINDSIYLLISDSLDEANSDHEKYCKVFKGYVDQVMMGERYKTISTSRNLDRFSVESEFFDKVYNLEIAPLSSRKVMAFLKELTKNSSLPERILEDAKRSAIFKDLPKCPIAAILLGQILSQGTRELPSSLPELYSQFIEVSVGRWENLKGLQSQREYRALDQILQNIAVYMIDAGADRLNREEAEGFFTNYLENRNFGIDPIDLFNRSIQRCSIICLMDGRTTFSFKHKSFAEFYYAKKMAGSKDVVIDNKVFTSYWSHIFYFFIGLVESPEEYLDKVINLKPSSEFEHFTKYINLSDFLLAGYISDYKCTIRGVLSALRSAAQVYLETIKGDSKQFLSNFPQAHLLWLIQYYFKTSYSYGFFERSYEEVANKLLDECNNNDELAFCLFLLDVTSQLNTKNAQFKYLELYKSHIPMIIQIGILHESKDMKLSKFAKKIDKNLKAKLRNNRKLNNDVERIHKVSLNKFIMTS